MPNSLENVGFRTPAGLIALLVQRLNSQVNAGMPPTPSMSKSSSESLQWGRAQTSAEISHHVIDTSGPDCSCGYRGCWESLATGPAMATWFNANTAGDRHSPENLSAAQICQLAKSGDELARQAVDREAYYLGLGLANLINLFVPEVIVLGGRMMKSAPLFLDGIRKVIHQGCRFVPHEKTELAMASLGEDANLIGAARVWHHRYRQGVGPAL